MRLAREVVGSYGQVLPQQWLVHTTAHRECQLTIAHGST